jgi:hypothetical protein
VDSGADAHLRVAAPEVRHPAGGGLSSSSATPTWRIRAGSVVGYETGHTVNGLAVPCLEEGGHNLPDQVWVGDIT